MIRSVKRNRLVAIALLVVASALAWTAASHANMAPPLGYRLGIELTRTPEGPRIAKIDDGEGAQAGLKVGDLILGIEGHYAKAMSDEDLSAFAKERHNWPMELIIARGDDIVTLRVPR
jgi:predicted metalloprotease with PDZ domain